LLSRLLGPPAPLPEYDRLEFPDHPIEYRIRASDRRRTLALRLDAGGTLTVSAPGSLPLERIRDFVARHRDWIDARRALLAQSSRHAPVLDSGAWLPYLDHQLELQVLSGPVPRCRRADDRLLVRAPDRSAVPRALEAWYRRMAARYFAERIEYFAPRVGHAPAAITVRGQRSRWGSCSGRGTISLNWRLMQASAAIVDYVIVHELCHLTIPDHSPRFWAEVARVLPEWRERRRALRTLGHALRF